nr:hypothetical protein [uncultured Bacillus sp.]
MKYQWRITKYNPAFRDLDGNYTKITEWTSASEIGKTFNGKPFTLNDYLCTENAYVSTVLKFLSESLLHSLRVVQFQKNELLNDKTNKLYENTFENVCIKEDLLVNEKDIPVICKMILRNFIQCHLISKDTFFAHFGWDYYMFIGSNQPCTNGITFAKKHGLYVESYQSPYDLAEENIIRMIEWTAIGGELLLGEERIKNVSLKELQKAFNLSEEHPVIGSFPITSQNKDFFQQYIKHKIDFNKHEYYLWGGD